MVCLVINYSGGSTPIHWLTIPFAALSVGQKAVPGSLELQVLPSYSPFWCCSWSKKTRNQRSTFIESKRILKTSRVTTCNKAEYSKKGFLRIYPETAHTTASSTTLAFHPHFFLFSSHRCIPSLFTLYSSSSSFYTRVTMAVDYDQFKGYVFPHRFLQAGVFERFMLTHHRKPFQVISKLGVRYTGFFDHISQEDQTICLAQGMSLSSL